MYLGGSYLGESYLGGIGDLAEVPEFPSGLTGLVSTAIEEFLAKQGDSGPAWIDELSYSDGKLVNLEGCTVQFVMRSLASRSSVVLTGTIDVPNPLAGCVLYSPSSDDTALAGDYMACWIVTYPSGAQMTFPTVGYRAVRIEASLTAETQQLLSLPEVKDYLNIDENDRAHDTKLLEHIEAVRPLIEGVTGPIVPQTYDEWFDGGSDIIALTHTPNRGPGTSPVLKLIAASEYRGAVEYPLSIVGSPVFGSVYSVMLNPREGTITRRSSGGAVVPFEAGRESVHVIYQAGQEQVPENVRMAAKEAIRVNYRTTQSMGRGKRSVADDQEPATPLGFFLPRRCAELLSPTKRAPSIA